MDLDFKRLAAEVSARHGIRVDPDDPIMAVVTLNRLVFEQAVSNAIADIRAATREFEEAADHAQSRIGARMAKEFRSCVNDLRASAGAEENVEPAPSKRTRVAGDSVQWFVLGLISAIVLVGVGVWVDRMLRF